MNQSTTLDVAQDEPLDLRIRSLPKDNNDEVNNNVVLNNEDSVNRFNLSSYRCQHKECSQLFTSTRKLLKHYQESHSEAEDCAAATAKPYQCTICEASFRQKHGLKLHMPLHSEEKPFPCRTCDKGFSRKVDLVRHERIHSGERPFSCQFDQCERSFVKKSDLIRHVRTHTGERPYKCSICSWRFARKESLKNHSLTHLAERPSLPVVLPVSLSLSPGGTNGTATVVGGATSLLGTCVSPPRNSRAVVTSTITQHPLSRTASTKSGSSSATEKQSDSRRHHCAECHHKFGKKSDLDRHMRTHSGDKPFPCGDCGARFTRRDYLLKHGAVKHKH